MKLAYGFAVKSIKGWLADGGTRLAAAVAFFTALSLAPLLTLVMLVLSVFLGDEAARGLLADEIANVTDYQTARFIESMISDPELGSSSLLAGLFGGALLLWGATRLFYEIQEALDIILGKGESVTGLATALKRRALALGMCMVVAFLLLVSLAVNTALSFAIDSVRLDLPGVDWMWGLAAAVSSWLIVSLLFTTLYRWLPLAKVPWRCALWGGGVSAGLFGVGRNAFSIYLARQDDFGGGAASLIAVLLWVYFSAQVFFLGAEVAKAVRERGESKEAGAVIKR
ncbi:YihY/virulence factor BrkB family protein [Pelagicoccus sp. SDUM812005]|uniref:YihY/virulence factor BrkB family protein n=1 Tax=Pelagicoccus sp. SDUM812005 TaxID=3041257 RepID=UPI00280EBCE5|nr:YihY/virulence factor BrkB family protein [Pelagicoccus sp. SDUM812005]MDQ8181051.1 YihY/virulence factor BrkB family protein [Pelagicoccus sp. SDUM812005]